MIHLHFPQFQWFSAIFTNPIPVTPNTKYALVLSCPYSATNNVYYWGYGFNYPSGGYPGGNRVNSFDGGLTWQIATWEDFLFKIFPLPTSYSNISIAQSLPYDTTFASITYRSFNIKQDLPPGTSTLIYFSDSSDKITWSDWTDNITCLSKRYLKWKIQLSTEDTSKTPIVDAITINYLLKFYSFDKVLLLESPNENITIEVVSSTPPPKSTYAIKQDPTFVTNIYKIGPAGTYFDPPAVLTFYYQDADNDGYVDGTNFRETELKICTYNLTTGLWEALQNQTIDTQNNLIKAEITHLSLFAIVYMLLQKAVPSQEDITISPSQEETTPLQKETTASPLEEEIMVEMDIDPDVLNLKSEGDYITVCIASPENFKNTIIDSANIFEINETLIEPIPAEEKFYKYEEKKSILKFKRENIKSILPLGEVRIKIRGIMRDEGKIIKFKGCGIIKVIEPGKAELITKSKIQINHFSGVEIIVPEDSVKDEVVIVMDPIENKDLPTDKKLAAQLQGLKIISGLILEPEGFTFEKPIEASFNITNENLGLYRWCEREKKWEKVEEAQITKGKIKTKVKSLSTYCVMETLSAPTFEFCNAYIYPNPAKYENPIIHIECGVVDSLKIEIFDISGELIHDVEIQGSNYITKNGKYCYEYILDTKNIETGVYICLICAEKQNYQPIKVIEKIAIIK